jgi:hypothetical protein
MPSLAAGTLCWRYKGLRVEKSLEQFPIRNGDDVCLPHPFLFPEAEIDDVRFVGPVLLAETDKRPGYFNVFQSLIFDFNGSEVLALFYHKIHFRLVLGPPEMNAS